MQNIDVPLDFCEFIFNKYTNAGTNINPPPVEKKPLTNPANNPITTSFKKFLTIKKPTFIVGFPFFCFLFILFEIYFVLFNIFIFYIIFCS